MNQIVACPHCSKRLDVPECITEKTVICPHCLADVDNTQPGSQIRAADINTDVKRDLSVGSIVLAVLIGVCVLGIAIAFFTPKEEPLDITLLMISFIGLDFLVSIAIMRVLIRWGFSGVRVPSAARVFGIVLLSLGTTVAVIIFSSSPV